MAGGNVAMMCSALHIHGIEHIGRVLADVRYWLDKREYTSIAVTRGSRNAFERIEIKAASFCSPAEIRRGGQYHVIAARRQCAAHTR